MAPNITVPMNFGRHLLDSPTHSTLELKAKNGATVRASSVILSFNSPVIDHMTTTLHLTSVDMEEFSEKAVRYFVDAAYSGETPPISRDMFRDINKMSHVFKVTWLVTRCSELFTGIAKAIGEPTYQDLVFLFDEAAFALKKTKSREIVKIAFNEIRSANGEEEFISRYIKENLHTLSHQQMDLILELATNVQYVVKPLTQYLVIPLVKDESQDPNLLKNYRPVSNLTFLGKLIERVVLRRLNEHLSRNNLHCQEQFAYKKHHSTETLLIKIVNDVLIAADEKTATVVMLLDLSAAFDTVDHNLLLRILRQEIGITGTALSWFTSFLKGRCQRIRLGKSVSETITIRFGVPQGSVLGPVLFNIYIRSLYRCVKESGFSIIGYADDHQIMKSFKPSDQVKILSNQLRNCFLRIKNWMSQYYLQLNDSKTQLIVFGPKKVLNEIELHGVEIAPNTLVMFVPTVKNLGLVMDNRLVFDKQIVNLKKKCFHTLRNIRKIRFLLSPNQIKIIVNSLVVSCLDYCNGLYFGIGEKLLHQLQLLQNAAAKAVTGKYKHDHLDDDLIKLHWLDVKKRIVFKILLLSHKSLLGLAPTYLQDMFKYAHHGHSLKLIVPSCNSKFGDRSFSVVAPKIYNRLPVTITSAQSLESFKAFLKTYLFKLSPDELEKLYR